MQQEYAYHGCLIILITTVISQIGSTRKKGKKRSSRSGGAWARGWSVEVPFFLRNSGKYLLASSLRSRGCVRNYTYWRWYLLVLSPSVNLKSPLHISVWILHELALGFTKSPSSKGQTAYMAFTTRGSMWVRIASHSNSASLLHSVTQNIVVVRQAASNGFFSDLASSSET